ncbi:MAG: alpha/beta fold hydrolase [Planctomycetota bacterium]
MDDQAKKQKVEEWNKWWEKEGKYQKLDLGALKERFANLPQKGTRERARDGVVHIEEDLENLRKALGVEKWIVLGHSYGGVLAQSYCVTYPHSTAGILGGNHPNGRLIIFQESGHSPFDDEPEVFFSTLKDFIGSLPNISAQKLEQWPKRRVKSS